MEKAIKQCAGIDCAKKDFAVTLSECDNQHEIKHLSSKKFENNLEGFKAFYKWSEKIFQSSIQTTFVMEATGVYHENLAHFLAEKNVKVVILLPKQAKDFSKTLKVKKITDKIASQYLATMGLEKKLECWVPPAKVYAEMKNLTREKEQIMKNIVALKNQLEAEECGYMPSKTTIKRINQLIKMLQEQRTEIEKELNEVIKSDPDLQSKLDLLTSIPGVGIVTAATVVGETNGFSQVRNKRQLVSYAGYDVINHESGTSINTKARISKRGNRNIRKAMHMPALAAIRHSDQSKAAFVRIVGRTGIKMKGVVAVQRKLLVLMYTLWKNKTSYDPHYEKIKGDKVPPMELDHVRS